jgi:hypothetical protein
MQPLAKDHTKHWVEQGHSFTAEISPCSWMDPDYGLQVGIAIDGDHSNGGMRFSRSKKPFAKCTVADFEALLVNIEVRPCPRCATGVRLVGSRDDTDLCERCFLQDLDRSFAALLAREQAGEAIADRRARARGYTHKVSAWVHPHAGDDYQIVFYSTGEPSAATAHAQLRKERSVRLDDYTVQALPAPTRARSGHA